MIDAGRRDETPPANRVLFPVLYLFYSFCYWGYLLYMPLYLQSRGMDPAHMGMLLSLFPLTTLVLIFPLGMLADRIEARAIISAGAAGVVVYSLLMPLANTVPTMIAAIVFGGFCFSLYFVGANALFFKYVGEEDRGRSTAMFFVGGTMGFGLGSMGGGLIVEHIGPGAIFHAGTVGALGMLIAGLKSPPTPLFRIRLKDYLDDLKKPAAIIVTLTVFVINTHVGVEQVSFALLMEHVVGLTGGEMGITFLFIAVWIGIWALIAGRLYDGSRKPVLVLGLALLFSGTFQYFTVYARGLESLVLLRLGHTLGDGLFNVIVLVLVGVTFPRKRVGGNFGFVLMVNTAAVFIAHNVGGLLMAGSRYDLPFRVSGIVMVSGAALLLIFRKRILRILDLHDSART